MMGLWHRYKVTFVQCFLSGLVAIFIFFLFQGCGGDSPSPEPKFKNPAHTDVVENTGNNAENLITLDGRYHELVEMYNRLDRIRDMSPTYDVEINAISTQIQIITILEMRDLPIDMN